MDQWLNVKDDTGMARANVAQIRSQIHKAEAAEKFWTGENKFWRQEHSSQYLEEDREAVKSIYGGIENLQSRYEATILGDSTENGLAISKELARLKGYLNELRIGGEDPKQGLIPYSGQVNPYEEQAFATFKIDFYHSNQAGLMNLHEQWSTVNDDTGFAKAQLEQIEEQQNLVTKATRFWTGEKHFWDRLGDAGQSEANASEIDQLLLQVTELENQMDQFLTLNDNSGTARHQRSKTMRQLNSTKAKIARLHTGF
jgi:hypothetical protein